MPRRMLILGFVTCCGMTLGCQNVGENVTVGMSDGNDTQDESNLDLKDVPGLDLSTGFVRDLPTEFSWDSGAKKAVATTNEDGTIITIDFFENGDPSNISVSAAVSETRGNPISIIRYDITQTEDLFTHVASFDWSVILQLDEEAELMDVTVLASNIRETAVFDFSKGEYVQSFPSNLEETLSGPNGPLAGMNGSMLGEYTKEIARLRPLFPTLTSFGISPEGERCNKCKDFSNFGCIMGCAACGGTFFIGPTCERWIDCIDCRSNGCL